MHRVLAGLMTVFCQSYISVHPEVILIDPVESVMRLQNRRQMYEYVSQSDIISCCEYFVAARRRYGTSLVLCSSSLFKECQRLHHMLIKLAQQGIDYMRKPRVEAALLENMQSRKPPVEAALVVTYLQFPVQVCLPCSASMSPTLLLSQTLLWF